MHWAQTTHDSSVRETLYSRDVFIVQMENGWPVYGAPFEMSPLAFRDDSFKVSDFKPENRRVHFPEALDCLQPLNILSQLLFPTKNKTVPLLCPFAASWLSRLLQQIFASEAVRRWSVTSSTYCHSCRQSRLVRKHSLSTTYHTDLQEKCVRKWIY